MLATVVALYNQLGPITPLLDGRRSEEVLRKKLTVLVTVVMMLVMVASPAWAIPGCGKFCSPINGNSGNHIGDARNDDSGNHTGGGAGGGRFQ